MAHSVLVDPLFVFNSVDLSDHVKSANLALSTAALDNTSGSATAVELFLAGLRSAKFSMRLFQDYASGEVDATLYAAWAARTAYAVRLSADKTSAISTSNPEYQFSAFITEYTGPINGGIGEVNFCDVTFALTTDITRDVTP